MVDDVKAKSKRIEVGLLKIFFSIDTIETWDTLVLVT